MTEYAINELPESFVDRVTTTSDGCWLWKGSVSVQGYANYSAPGGQLFRAHRFSYEALVGPIPADRVIDHVCHDPRTCPGGPHCLHRRCVNPAHLTLVTHEENAARTVRTARTHCVNGHPWNAENTRIRPDGARACRACVRESSRQYAERRRLAV